MSNGPATAAPRLISIAITTPPWSYGFTIQLSPRSAIERSASPGRFCRSIARSIPCSTARTSSSVHASGVRATPSIAAVCAKSVPRSHTSTEIFIAVVTSIGVPAYPFGRDHPDRSGDPTIDACDDLASRRRLQFLLERIRAGDRLAAGEVLTDVRRRAAANRLHRGEEREAAAERALPIARGAKRDGERKILAPQRGFERIGFVS